MTRHATESYEHNRCDFENWKRVGRVLDATDKYGTVCHGMSNLKETSTKMYTPF